MCSSRTFSVSLYRYLMPLVWLLVGHQAYASTYDIDLPISKITVVGNDQTQTRFILKWANLHVGDILTADKLKKARQNIIDTTLFKRVTLSNFQKDSQVSVNIDVEEKTFTLLLPRLSRNSNGDVKAGFKLRMHNINGANQTLGLLAEQADYSDGDKGLRYKIDYKLPQFSQPYTYRWQIGESTTSTVKESFRNTEQNQYVSFAVSREIKTRLFKLPLDVGIRLKLESLTLDNPYPTALNEVEAGNFNHIGLKVEYDGIHHQRFRRFGRYFSLSYEQGFAFLDTDYESRIIEFEYRVFRPLDSKTNFNSRFFAGLSEHSPFSRFYYDLGGADNVRGLDRDAFSGDAIIFANFEYVVGYSNYPSLRNNFFFDIGNVFDDAQSININNVHTAVGVGIRWKLTSFIKTDLYVDLAYEPEDGNTQIYGGTRLNF